jgi:quinol monooxygenase YgiN
MIVHWVVPVGESGPITRALQQLMIAARASVGCLGCSVSTEMSTQTDVSYVERWASEDLLQRELRSDRFAALVSLMEHATGAARIEFELPGGTRGLDYVAETKTGSHG